MKFCEEVPYYDSCGLEYIVRLAIKVKWCLVLPDTQQGTAGFASALKEASFTRQAFSYFKKEYSLGSSESVNWRHIYNSPVIFLLVRRQPAGQWESKWPAMSRCIVSHWFSSIVASPSEGLSSPKASFWAWAVLWVVRVLGGGRGQPEKDSFPRLSRNIWLVLNSVHMRMGLQVWVLLTERITVSNVGSSGAHVEKECVMSPSSVGIPSTMHIDF